MHDVTDYSLEVYAVRDLPSGYGNAEFYLEVECEGNIRRTGRICNDGKPTRNATHWLSRADKSTILHIRLKMFNLEKQYGYAHVSVAELFASIGQHLVQLHCTLMGGKESQASICAIEIHLNPVDTFTRSKIEVEVAQDSIELMMHTGNLESSDVIELVIKAADQIVAIVDEVAKIHPIISLSWKLASGLYSLVSYQFEKDKKLVTMVDQMQKAFDFATEANILNDRTKMLKPYITKLLAVTVECSHFVKEYSSCNFLRRLAHLRNGARIDGYTTLFGNLRSDLDSVINLSSAIAVDDLHQQQKEYVETILHIADRVNDIYGQCQLGSQIASDTEKMVVDIELHQKLEDMRKVLDPTNSSFAELSTLPRCLEDTRHEYFLPIMEFVFSKSVEKNVLWLSGAAGSGKTTIAVTISDACEEYCKSIHLFFEWEKRDPSYVVRTIANKLVMLNESVAKCILGAFCQNRNIINSMLETQFEKLLLKPLRSCAQDIVEPTVIFLDGLDEYGTIEQRRELLLLIKTHFMKLPPQVRFVITSRPEKDIVQAFSSTKHILHVSLNYRSDAARRDVGTYIQKEMKVALGEESSKVQELDEKLRVLADAADGLFIWASTATRMVRSSDSRLKTLEDLVKDAGSIDVDGIDCMYTTALMESGISWRRPASKERFTVIIGIVLFAKESMITELIEAFLGLEAGEADCTLSRLRSVLLYKDGQPIRLHHASFADYLLSPERSGGHPWHIDAFERKRAVTERCFEVMGMLSFNICRMGTSFIRNKDLSDLPQCVSKSIPTHLEYACVFWSTHLMELDNVDSKHLLKKKLKEFGTVRLLYWLEVLSMTGHFGRIAIRALYDASAYTAPFDAEISSLFLGAYKLASIFAYPISQSAPHIYVSAVSLWREELKTMEQYSKTHPIIRVHRSGVRIPSLCLQVFKGHTGSVTSIAHSHDGKRTASGSEDGTIKIWDADSGELLVRQLKGHANGITSIAFSPSGNRLVSASYDKALRIWDATNGKQLLGPLNGHAKWVTAVAFSYDEKQIVSGSGDCTVRIWDVSCGTEIACSDKGHGSWVSSVAFAPCGQRIVSGSADKTIRIWVVDNAKLTSSVIGRHGDWVTSVTFSPDGGRIASCSDDKTVCVWDASSGNLLLRPMEGHTKKITSIAYSPDGKRIVSGSYDETIRVWDAGRGELICGPFKGHKKAVTSVTFSSDGKRVFSGSVDKTIRVWDAYGGEPSGIEGGSTNIFDVVGIFSTARRYGTWFASHLNPFHGRHNDNGYSEGHADEITSVAFCPHGERVVSGSADSTVRVWDVDNTELLLCRGHTERIAAIAISSDGKLIVSGAWDKTIRIWDAKKGRPISNPLRGHKGIISSIAISENGRRIVSGSWDTTIQVWDARSELPFTSKSLEGHTGVVHSIALSHDEKRIISGSYDRSVRMWDADTGKVLSDPFLGHTDEVCSVAISHDGRRIASGSLDKTICIWDTETGRLVVNPLEGHTLGVTSISFSPDGKRLISGSHDKTIRIWDAIGGRMILGPFEGHVDSVLSVAFSCDGNRVVSGSRDRTIRIWEVGHDSTEANARHSSAHGLLSAFLSRKDKEEKSAVPNWTLSEDGWIQGERGELLVWIPEDMRRTLWRPQNSALLSCPFSTRLDFSNSPIGTNWSEGFPRHG